MKSLAVLMFALLVIIYTARFILQVIVLAFENATQAIDDYLDVVFEKESKP